MRFTPGHNDQGYASYEGAIATGLAAIALLLFGGFALMFLTGLFSEMGH